jgi:hypothetical protein
MVGRELGDRVAITPLNRAEQILGLTSELTQVGMHGKMTLGHGQPPWICPMSAGDGRRRFVRTGRQFVLVRWTRPFPRTGGALRAVGKVVAALRDGKPPRLGGASWEGDVGEGWVQAPRPTFSVHGASPPPSSRSSARHHPRSRQASSARAPRQPRAASSIAPSCRLCASGGSSSGDRPRFLIRLRNRGLSPVSGPSAL